MILRTARVKWPTWPIASESYVRVGNLVESLNTGAELDDAAVGSVHARICPMPSLETETDFVGERVLTLFLESFEQSGVQSKGVLDRQTFPKAASPCLELSV